MIKSDLPPHHEHTRRDAHCASVQRHQFYVGFAGSRGRTLFVPTIFPFSFRYRLFIILANCESGIGLVLCEEFTRIYNRTCGFSPLPCPLFKWGAVRRRREIAGLDERIPRPCGATPFEKGAFLAFFLLTFRFRLYLLYHPRDEISMCFPQFAKKSY